MVMRAAADKATNPQAGFAVGLAIGGAVLIVAQLVLPSFFVSFVQVLGMALIWAVIGAFCSIVLGVLGPERALAGSVALLTTVALFGIGKLLFPSSLWGLIVLCVLAGLSLGVAASRWGGVPTKKIVLTGLLLTLAAASLPAIWSQDQKLDSRMVVVGLDAGTWTILKELFERGDLPHIQEMVATGVSGTLLSEDPTMSPRVWTSIASGKRPIKHGVEDFCSASKRSLPPHA